jgi:nucleoside-diphosphate-sugar epimerase
MTTILVTGASGLLGANTIQELLNNGYQIKALVRDKNKYVLAEHQNVELIEGSLADPIIREKAVKDCKYIVHTAAETSQSKIHYSEYYKTNVEFTGALYNIAIKSGVKRIIHVSTSNVFGFGDLQNLGDENTPIKSPFTDSLYVQSKIASQNLALTFSDKIDVIIVNPTFLIGPFDQKPSSGRIVLHGYGKGVIFYPPGGKNFVDARDVAKAIVVALINGKNKESYVLAGDNLSYKQFFERLIANSSKKTLLIEIPRVLLLLAGVFGNILKKLGVENEFTLTNMKILCVKNYYSNLKSKNELNIEFQPIDNAIVDTINWFKYRGTLDNKGERS